MNILVFNDPHVSAVPPTSRIDMFEETCYRKLSEVKDISEKFSCQYVLCTGDMFHLKAWNKNPTRMIGKLQDLFKSFKMPVKSLVGNHDTVGLDPETVYDQPFGVMARGANIELLRKEKIYPLDEKVVLTAVPNHAQYDITPVDYLPDRPSGFKTHIHLTHGALLPNRPVYSPVTVYGDISTCKADILCNGHIHSNLGIQAVGNTRVCNVGSLTRGALTDDDIKRKPSVMVIDTDKMDFEIIELKTALPASQVFDLVKAKAIERAEQEITKLGELIKKESENVELSGPESIRQIVRDLKALEQPIKDLIYKLLDEAERCA